MSETSGRVIAHLADDLLEVLLLKDEFELEGWWVEGGEAFQQAFLSDAQTATSGRSLNDFDLLGRLFKHRLSYMIYSQAFEALPNKVKQVVYEKLLEALSDGADHPLSGHPKPKECQSILTILLETKDNLPIS